MKSVVLLHQTIKSLAFYDYGPKRPHQFNVNLYLNAAVVLNKISQPTKMYKHLQFKSMPLSPIATWKAEKDILQCLNSRQLVSCTHKQLEANAFWMLVPLELSLQTSQSECLTRRVSFPISSALVTFYNAITTWLAQQHKRRTFKKTTVMFLNISVIVLNTD